MIEEVPRTLPYAEAGCVGAKDHRPRPLITEQHHVFPMYLQARVWPNIDPNRPSTARVQDKAHLCGNCHATVHVVITALISGLTAPHVAPPLLRLAREGYVLYVRAIADP